MKLFVVFYYLFDNHVDFKIELDFYAHQIHIDRAWKMMVVALTQSDSIDRYLTMMALTKAIPVIKETLFDEKTKWVFITFVSSKMLIANGLYSRQFDSL